MNKINIKKRMSGQVVLMVLLVSALVLTMGLSASKNTVIETKIDTDENLLKQAFNTAESGVEYYLATGETQYNSDNGNASVVTTDIGNVGSLDSSEVVLNGKPFLFWLVNHEDDGSVGSDFFDGTINQICVDSSFTGGLKVDLVSFNGGNYSIRRYGYNMNNGSAVSGFSADNNSCTQSIVVAQGMLLVVTPIGGSTNLSVDGNINFPSQGEKIVSIGQMDGGVNTKVTVLNRFDEVPPFMLETITAGNSVLSQ